MADYIIRDTTLTAIADSIRAKTGSTDPIKVSDMASTIEGITGGGGSAEGCVTVTFMNGDTVLFTRPVYVGDDCPDPVEQGRIETPTKDSTAQYTYTHNGWATADGGSADSNALKGITEDKVLYAAYTSVVRYYTVTYYDEDGVTVLHTEQLPYGATPSYVPTKEGAVFDGWATELIPVTGDVSYTVASWLTALGSGSCGAAAYWLLAGSGALTIYGEGEVTSLPWAASSLRDYITDVVVEEGIISLPDNAFNGCGNMANIALPSTLTQIGNFAFSNCQALVTAFIPSLDCWWGVRILSAQSNPAFNKSTTVLVGNTEVTGELVVPDWVTSIPDYLFYNWKGVTSVVLHSGVTSIGLYAFHGTSISLFTVPDTVTSVGHSAFRNCDNLTSIDFGNITTIPPFACEGCDNLSSVVFSENTTTIERQAFYGDKKLISVVIPSAVTKIDTNAFASSGLSSAVFDDTEGWNAGSVAISSTDLANPATAATYLTNTYKSVTWTNS